MSNTEMKDIVKIVKSLQELGLLMKDATETIENGAKEQQCAYLVILFGLLGASLSENMLAGNGVILAGEETIRAGIDYSCHIIISPIYYLKLI